MAKCEPGCVCRRHLPSSPTCSPGCTCKRHTIKQSRRDAISRANKGRRVTHGMTNHPLYSTWVHMMARCHGGPDGKGYSHWGRRGISVCDDWRDMRRFVWWMESCEGLGWRPEGDISFDRIDNDGNYEPGNVRWATRSEQNQNRRSWTREVI